MPRFRITPATTGFSIPDHGSYTPAEDGTFDMPLDGALIGALEGIGYKVELVEEPALAADPKKTAKAPA